MGTGPEVPAPAAENPAAAADAQQHALQEMAGLRPRAVVWARAFALSAVAAAGGILSAWLIRRRRRR